MASIYGTDIAHGAPIDERSDVSFKVGALGTGENGGVHVSKIAAAIGTALDFLCEERTVALDIDVEIVLENERHHVLHTQIEVAARLGSSQSRVAKMEAGDRSVSLDLLVKSLLRIGASPASIAKWIRRAETNRAA